MKAQFIAVALAAFPAATIASAAQPPAGQSYSLKVSASFEKPFTDCWAFAGNGKYIVSYGGLGSFPYRLTGLNSNPGHFQAVWRGHVSIGFSGTTNGSAIAGDGVDSQGRTYSYTGSSVGSCQGAAIGTAGAFFRKN